MPLWSAMPLGVWHVPQTDRRIGSMSLLNDTPAGFGSPPPPLSPLSPPPPPLAGGIPPPQPAMEIKSTIDAAGVITTGIIFFTI